MIDQAGTGADALDQEVRRYVFGQAAATARLPSPGEVAAGLGRSQAELEVPLRRLAANRVLVLAPGTANVWVAPPFCAVPSDFRVRACGRTYWGVCVWDALGIPAALHADAAVAAVGGECGEELVLEVRGGALARGEGVIHFGVPAARWWDNIGFA